MTESKRQRKHARKSVKNDQNEIWTESSQTLQKGVYSCTYAVVIAFLVIVMILFSFMNKGNVNILMGFFGLGTCAMAVIGIWLGIKGFREREKIYTTCKVGITVNAVFLVAMVALFVRGLCR